jgi:hypothetical protein
MKQKFFLFIMTSVLGKRVVLGRSIGKCCTIGYGLDGSDSILLVGRLPDG